MPTTPPALRATSPAKLGRKKSRRAGRLEFLHAFAVVDFARVDVALGIDRDAVHPVELAGGATGATEAADHGAVAAAQDAQEVVFAVDVEQPGLVGVGPEVQVPHRAGAQRG